MKALLLAVSAGFCADTCFWMFLADHMPPIDEGRSSIALVSFFSAISFFLGPWQRVRASNQKNHRLPE